MVAVPDLLTIPTRAVGTADPAGDMNAVVKQVNALLNYARAIAAGIGEMPHLLCTGSGTEADPWVHADGTAGIQTCVNKLAALRGGKVILLAGVYQFAAAAKVTITTPSITVEGLNGFNIDPNGEEEGITGTKIRFTKSCFQIGTGGEGERLGNILVQGIYGWGASVSDESCIFLQISGRLDQAKFLDINTSNVGYAALVDNARQYADGTSGGNLDTAYFQRFNALRCGRGIVDKSKYPSYFCHYDQCCLSDIDYQALLLQSGIGYAAADGRQAQQATLQGCTIVRAARKGGNAVELYGRGFIVTNNVIRDTGWLLPTSSRAGARTYATGIYCGANDCLFTSNQITSSTGPGLVLAGVANKVRHNSWSGGYGDVSNGLVPVYSQAKGYSSNEVDVKVLAGAADNQLVEGEFTYINAGLRTTVNNFGTNVGDPNSAGEWNGRYKWDGLYIFNTQTTGDDAGKEWLYRSAYAGGRRLVSTTAGSGSTGTGSSTGGTTTYPIASPQAGFIQVANPTQIENDNPNIIFSGTYNQNNNPTLFINGTAALTASDGQAVIPIQCVAPKLTLTLYMPLVTDFGVVQVSFDGGANFVDYNQQGSGNVASIDAPKYTVTAPYQANSLYNIVARRKNGQVCLIDHIDAVPGA